MPARDKPPSGGAPGIARTKLASRGRGPYSESVAEKGAFGRRLSCRWWAELPSGPGVYLFRDSNLRVVYVGKAKNLRRRLLSYRNAGRTRAHRKMRRLAKAAHSVELEEHPSEQAALLRENELIVSLRPPFNVEGAYSFLYPAIGLGRSARAQLLCFTTDPDAYAALGLHWYGSFRSRPRAKLAFEALVDLLALVAHREQRSALPPAPSIRGSRLVGLRRLPGELATALPALLSGADEGVLASLSKVLLHKPRALRDAGEVQARLRAVQQFFEQDARRLRSALLHAGLSGTFVPQERRDALFIQASEPASVD